MNMSISAGTSAKLYVMKTGYIEPNSLVSMSYEQSLIDQRLPKNNYEHRLQFESATTHFQPRLDS